MNALLLELREKALGLPPTERRYLADDLIESLEDEPLTQIEEPWMNFHKSGHWKLYHPIYKLGDDK